MSNKRKTSASENGEKAKKRRTDNEAMDREPDLVYVDSFPIHDSQGDMTLTVTPGNKILITYGSQDCIRMYDFGGHELNMFSAESLGLSHFFPSDACVRPSDGRVVVTTGVCSRLHYFRETADGLELEKEHKFKIEDAQKLTVMANDDIVVCGYKFKQEIKHHSSEHGWTEDLRIPNNGLPSYVVADGNYPLYIALKDQNRLAEFDENLSIAFRGNGFGTRKGQFIGIGGLCVDNDHNVLVADEGNNRLQRLDRAGKWQVLTVAEYKLRNPLDVAFWAGGELVVLTRNFIILFRYTAHAHHRQAAQPDTQTQAPPAGAEAD